MIRRLVVIACSVLVCGAPLADSFCYAGCTKSQATETHHSCAHHRDDRTALDAVPHGCEIRTEATTAEVRHTTTALAVPPVVRFSPSLRIDSVTVDADSRVSTFSPQPHTPLRI